MSCRHSPGDPSCSSSPNYVRPYEEPRNPTPDSANYSIEEFERVGAHLVLKVKYPNCARCAFEGNKVMVFLNVTEKELVKWKRIDPHFRLSSKGGQPRPLINDAPSPAARFPPTDEGWRDALNYAENRKKT